MASNWASCGKHLRTADDAARAAHGHWLAVDSRSGRRLNRSTLGAVAALATALRSGRSARRDQLRRLNDDKLTRALPLWVGTLADVDDLLPAVPGLFDLVILDEASSIDQVLAAPALLRGTRAVIAGDPHQLRHVSFLSDDLLGSMIAAHGLTEPALVSRLDVRRNSIFDVAAGVAPVTVLDEHFRSKPHLVEFVAKRLYGGHVRIATRSPTNESKDCITVVRLTGGRDSTGVVRPEVDRAMAELRALLRSGVRSVGVVTPFRAQADALEEAALRSFDVDELEALDLRIGTVHAFQGIERDVVIASLGFGSEDAATSWRFVEDPHLLAVFMTRARDRLILLLSADPPEGGLVRAYIDQADRPPRPPAPTGPVSAWAGRIAEELELAGIAVIAAYPSGRHDVDVCLHFPDQNLGIECGVHPEGPVAHIQRHLDLERRGWELIELTAHGGRIGERSSSWSSSVLCGRSEKQRPVQLARPGTEREVPDPIGRTRRLPGRIAAGSSYRSAPRNSRDMMRWCERTSCWSSSTTGSSPSCMTSSPSTTSLKPGSPISGNLLRWERTAIGGRSRCCTTTPTSPDAEASSSR